MSAPSWMTSEWTRHFELTMTRTPHVYVKRDPTPFGLWTVYAYWGGIRENDVRFAWTRKRAAAKGARLVRKRLAAANAATRDFVIEVAPESSPRCVEPSPAQRGDPL